MFLIYKERDGNTYATAAVSKRNGEKTSMEYTYIGKVIDKESNVFFSRKRGYFTFDVETDTYGCVGESFSPPAMKDGRRRELRAFDFGDSFLLDSLLWKSGLWHVIDNARWGNKDSLHSMVIYYMASRLPNRYAQSWYEGNVAHLLYPGACMDDTAISSMLAQIGRPESLLAYQKAFIDFVLKRFPGDTNIMVESTVIPDKGRMRLTQLNVHNKASVEARIVVVAQKSTAIPLYFQVLPGSVNDAISLRSVIEHCRQLGINVDGCLLDAGYSTDINIDEFYNESHECTVEYITRPKSTAAYYVKALEEILPSLESKENLVQYKDRYVFIKHADVKVGKNSDQPAHLYVGLDTSALSDELHKLLVRAKQKKLSATQVYEGMENQGIFALLSGKRLDPVDILPEYYLRQGIEQLNDISKNYTKLLPARTHSPETFSGHVLLSMIGTAVIRFMQIQINDTEECLGSRIETLCQQKAIKYESKLVADPPTKLGNDLYKAFKIESPVSIKIENGKLMNKHPDEVNKLFKVPKKRKPRKGKDESTELQKNQGEPGNIPGQEAHTQKQTNRNSADCA